MIFQVGFINLLGLTFPNVSHLSSGWQMKGLFNKVCDMWYRLCIQASVLSLLHLTTQTPT